MDLKSLMAGMAVVIDDAIENAVTEGDGQQRDKDLIVGIVERIEQQWTLPFYKAKRMPPKQLWSNLLQGASFILLDWQLWPTGAPELEREGIRENIRFLGESKGLFRPSLHFHK